MSESFRLSLRAEKETAQKIADLFDSETGISDCPVITTAVALFEQPNNNWCVDTYISDQPELDQIRAYLRKHVDLKNVFALKLNPVADIDWVSHVRKSMPPVSCGRFVCYGSHDRKNVSASRYSFEIDAGQAFGTSHHGTTKGCLTAIDRLSKLTSFQHILDIGTGSGILSVAASRAWPKCKILATDLDPIAIETTIKNSQLNGVSNQVTALGANGLNHRNIRGNLYGLIIANILAGPLKQMASDISAHLKPGGYSVLSGILDSQSRRLEAHYWQYGLTLETRMCLEGWTTLILSKS